MRGNVLKVDFTLEVPSKGLEEFISEFYHDRIKELLIMKGSFENKDLLTIKSFAHKWKGYCTPYGFNYLEVLSIQLEKSIEENNFEEISLLLHQVSDYLEQKGRILNI